MFYLYFFMNDVLTVINIPLECMHILDFVSQFGAKAETAMHFLISGFIFIHWG